MKFRMVCPKCQTTNFSIERDNRSYAPRGQMFEMIFSCRCGKQLFGDQIEAEYLRQQTEFLASKQAQRIEPSVPAREERPQQPTVAVAVQDESPQSWKDTPATATEADSSSDTSSCEWHICNNPPRPNSKYCSRDCSNKNARLRYKKRKNADKAAA